MRFYLLYKNHGLYDPVLDDTEYFYVPVEPEQLDVNRAEYEANQRTETATDKNSGDGGSIKEPLNVPAMDEKIKSKANFHEALLKINAGDIPESAKFKLPISEEYDPDGRKITKLQKLYAKKMTGIDLKTIIEKIKQDDNKVTENLENSLECILGEHEMTKNEPQYSQIKEESNFDNLKKTASRIVGESIDKAVSLAKEIKQEIDVELENTQNLKIESEVIKESLYLKSKSLSPTNAEIDKDGITTEYEKEKLNVAEEIQKFESFKAPMDSKVNLEERRLLRKQDVQETIEEGTVRRRSDIFKEINLSNNIIKKTNIPCEILSMPNQHKTISISNLEKSQIHEDTRKMKSGTKETEQKAFTLGVDTIPRLRQVLLSSYNSNLLLKTFFLQLTKVMVALSKLLTLEQTMGTSTNSEELIKMEKDIKHEGKSETTQEKETENVECSKKYSYEIDSSTDDHYEGEIIKKEKLSGAKIAQIEGNKPAELTDKMDIVISELLKKTVLEESSENEEFFRRSSQSDDIRKVDETNTNNKNNNSKDSQHDHFFDQRGKHFDRRKLYDILEEKTKTMEIKEMISKKHTTEYKSMRTNKTNGNIIYYIALVETKHFPNFEEIRRTKNLYEHEIKTEMKNDENLVYVAIVEAHSNINEEAILKEQMRRQLKIEALVDRSEKQTVEIEDIKKVETLEMDTQKLSLANTAIIEPVKVSLTVTPIHHEQLKFARSATDMEQISKKIAVQNIVHAIEPLLRHETQKIYNKQALSVIEKPTKAIAETTDVKVEESQTFFKAEVSVEQKSFVSIEKPESVVEITEITTEEDENIPVAILKPIVSEPRSDIEIAGKFVAEVSEIKTDEANIEMLPVPNVIDKKPSIVLEKPILSVAETFTAMAEYKSDDIVVSKVVGEQAKVNVETNVAAEVLEVSAIEKEHDTLKIEKIHQKQSDILHENSALMIAETTKTFSNEPKDEPLELCKTMDHHANIDFQKSIATNISVVHTEETYKENLQTFEMKQKLPQATSESPLVSAAETLTLSPEEPRNETLIIPQTTPKQSKPVIETPTLTAPEYIITATEGPRESSLKLPETVKQVADIDIKEHTSLISNMVVLDEPKPENIEVPRVTPEQSYIRINEFISLMKSMMVPIDQCINLELQRLDHEIAKTSVETQFLSVAVTLATLLGGPKDDVLDIKPFITNQVNVLMEMPSYTLAKVLMGSILGPKEQAFETPETKHEQCNVILEKYLTFITSLDVPLDNYTDLKREKSRFLVPEISIESIILTVASCLTILLTGPKEEKCETEIVNKYQAKAIMEMLYLTVPEVITIFVDGPKESHFDFPKVVKEECNIVIKQYKSLVKSIMTPIDQYNDMNVPKINMAVPLVTLENIFMPVAIVLTTLILGPNCENFEILKTATDRAKIIFTQLEAILTSCTYALESNQDIEIQTMLDKLPQITIENCLFVPESFVVETEGPKEDNIKITKLKFGKSSASINAFKAVEVMAILLGEIINENLKVPQIVKRKSQLSLEDVNLHIANVLTVYSEEPKDKPFNVDTKIEHKARVKIEELKAAEVKFMPIEEPEPDEFVTSELNKKQTQASLQSSLMLAQNLAVSSVESVDYGVNILKTSKQNAFINVEALKSAESFVTLPEEPKEGLLHRKQAASKNISSSVVENNLRAAETSIVQVEENEFETEISAKSNAYKQAKLEVEPVTFIAQQNIVTAMEKTHDVMSHEYSLSKSAKSSVVESSINAIAKIKEEDTEVNVLIETPKSKPIKVEDIEIEANLKIPAPLNDSVSEVSAEYSVKVPQEENVYAEFGFSERKIDVDIVSEIYESIRLMKKQAFQKQSMEASLSLAKELQAKIEMAEIDALQEEFIRNGSISNSSSMASSPLTPLLEEYFFNLKGPSLMSRYRRFQDVFEEASLKLKSKIQTSTIQNLDASLTLILQDLAMAQLESEENDVEIIEIEDYEDVRNLHFSTALMAMSQKQSLASFISSESKAMHTSSVSQNSYGYSMSVEDADLKEFIKASSDKSSHVHHESSASQHLVQQGMARKISKSVKFADTVKYDKLQSASAKIHTSQISATQMEGVMDDNIHHSDILTSGELKLQGAKSKKKSKDITSINVSGGSVASSASETCLVEGLSRTMETSSLETRSMEGGSIKTNSAKSSITTELNSGNLKHLDIHMKQGIESSQESSSELSAESQKKLSIKTDIKRKEGIDITSPSPPTLPPTPLTDEYIFRLQTQMPEPSEFIPRDCSLSPERVQEEIILKGGLIPHIKTSFERVLYSPPFLTPPTSPDKTVPVYSTGGGKSGFFKFLS